MPGKDRHSAEALWKISQPSAVSAFSVVFVWFFVWHLIFFIHYLIFVILYSLLFFVWFFGIFLIYFLNFKVSDVWFFCQKLCEKYLKPLPSLPCLLFMFAWDWNLKKKKSIHYLVARPLCLPVFVTGKVSDVWFFHQ